MFKKISCIVSIFCIFQVAYADSSADSSGGSLFEQMGEDILKPYVSPLVTSIGIGMGSGLFHRADAHKILGFDFSIKTMWIPIPKNAKTHTYRVMKLSVDTATQAMDTTYVNIEGSTILGDSEVVVPVAPNETAIPDKIPGGINFPGVPFAAPQLNLGMPFGTEVMLRWIPSIPIKMGEDEEKQNIGFFGAGLKWEVTSLFEMMRRHKKTPAEKDSSAKIDTMTVDEEVQDTLDEETGEKAEKDTLLPEDSSTVNVTKVGAPEKQKKSEAKNKQLPFSVAIQGAYQQLKLGDIMSFTTKSINMHIDYKLGPLRPYVGIGLEGTTFTAKYDYEYEIPDTANPDSTVTKTQRVEANMNGENGFRVVLGFAIEASILIHADYNIGKYPSFNAGIGFSIR